MSSTKITARWAFNVSEWNPSDEQYQQILSFIQPEEKSRINRSYFIEDAKLSLIDWVVLVASESSLIGVDVMKVELPSNQTLEYFFETLKDRFSDYEWSTITNPNYTEFQQLHQFYQFWCLKESYVKAIGLGLSLDLRSIEFHLSNEESSLIENPQIIKSKTQLFINNELQPEWKFEESYLDDLHCVGITYNVLDHENIINSQNFDKFEIDEILKYAKKLN
ncbi:hypothetical protein RhiirB3_431025 [Rhizophagus irregularis]|nr:hypothetical protein RhiirB3_431025 [Rhizophagus irregularis]